MPRKFLKRFMPDVHKLNQYGVLKPFGAVAHDTNLWHLNRKNSGRWFCYWYFLCIHADAVSNDRGGGSCDLFPRQSPLVSRNGLD